MIATIQIIVHGGTDSGIRRPNNEDAYIDRRPNQAPEVLAAKGLLYIVADGVGGNEAGEVASEMAVTITRQLYYSDPNPDVPSSLVAAIEEANRRIYHQALSTPAQHGMGTTLTAVVVRGNQFYIANVGDSRAYLMRNGQTQVLTRDHTWVADKVAEGLMTREEAASHPQRNVITRSLGQGLRVQVDCFGPHVLQKSDSLLLCTDGLSDLVDAPELHTVVTGFAPAEAVRRLIALARQRGAPDNVTALIVGTRTAAAQRAPASIKGGQFVPWLLGALLLIGIVGAGGWALANRPVRPTPIPTEAPVEPTTTAPTTTPAPAETPLPDVTPLAPELVEPGEGASFYPNATITLRWGAADLPEEGRFELLLANEAGVRVTLPDEGRTRERTLTLGPNTLDVGTYRWFVLLSYEVEGEWEEQGRSATRTFTIRPYPPTAAPTPTETPEPTVTPLPTEAPPDPTSPPEGPDSRPTS